MFFQGSLLNVFIGGDDGGFARKWKFNGFYRSQMVFVLNSRFSVDLFLFGWIDFTNKIIVEALQITNFVFLTMFYKIS